MNGVKKPQPRITDKRAPAHSSKSEKQAEWTQTAQTLVPSLQNNLCRELITLYNAWKSISEPPAPLKKWISISNLTHISRQVTMAKPEKELSQVLEHKPRKGSSWFPNSGPPGPLSLPTTLVHAIFFLEKTLLCGGLEFRGCEFHTDNCLCLIINIDDSCQISVLSVSLQFLKLAVRMFTLNSGNHVKENSVN